MSRIRINYYSTLNGTSGYTMPTIVNDVAVISDRVYNKLPPYVEFDITDSIRKRIKAICTPDGYIICRIGDVSRENTEILKKAR